MKRTAFLIALLVAVLALHHSLATSAPEFDTPRKFELVEATIPEIREALETHFINSKWLVKRYLDRIATYEGTLNAYIAINPNAVDEAHRLDVERAQGKIRGPLHGIPIVLKDIIHTTDMPTTGGALAFQGFVPPYEATLTRKLREAGAVILGKTVLTELANWTSDQMVNNYSAVGGFGFNPYDPRPDPRFADGRPVLDTGGSSSGIATAANLAAGSVGTETSGSILSPSNRTMLVGIKPTVGLISRWGVIPISAEQDTPGPMTRDVASAAIMLGAMSGFDPNDQATATCPEISDYTQYLDPNGLSGARIGFPRDFRSLSAPAEALMEEAIAELEAAGAEVEDVTIPSQAEYFAFPPCARGTQTTGNDLDCSIVLKYAFKRDFNAWLDTLGPSAPVSTLTELIQFNNDNVANNAIMFGQQRLELSEDVDLVAAEARFTADRAIDLDLTATRGIDAALAGPDQVAGTSDDYDALLFPGRLAADIAARPGYPSVTVPFGSVPNDGGDPFPPGFDPQPEPFGVTFTGTACSEGMLIRLGFSFEQATLRRMSPESAPPLKKDVKGNRNR